MNAGTASAVNQPSEEQVSIVTKTGDNGETSLLGGKRTAKTDLRIKADGTVDELNASIGMALVCIKNENAMKTLEEVQNELFRIGAELSAAGTDFTKFPRITEEHTNRIEKEICKIEENLPRQKGFILPRGTESSARLHIARTICRRAERASIACKEFLTSREVTKYLNRLGDLLFIYARLENNGRDEEVKYGEI